MKSGKFINLNVNEQFKCGYGTVDSKNLKSIYSKITCWIEPTNNVTNWNTVIGGLKRKISGKLTETLNNYAQTGSEYTKILNQIII